jgi:4-amino-4-deoxy-L-arabinose transferase-like glycosyltransferase
MFMIIDRYVFCQNFRYVLPMLIPLAVLFMRGMEIANDSRLLKPLYWLGMITGMLLVVGAVILYLAQYSSF